MNIISTSSTKKVNQCYPFGEKVQLANCTIPKTKRKKYDFSVVYWSLGGLCMSNMYSLLIFKVNLPTGILFFVCDHIHLLLCENCFGCESIFDCIFGFKLFASSKVFVLKISPRPGYPDFGRRIKTFGCKKDIPIYVKGM